MKFPMPDIWETGRAVKLSFFEFKATRKYKHSLEVDCLYVDENSIGTPYQGMTDEASSFLYVPLLQRVWRNLHPIHIDGRKRFFILSSRNRNTINIPEIAKRADLITQAFKAKMTVNQMMGEFLKYKWQYADNVIAFEVENCPTTINPTAMDTELDADFTADAFRILQTKNLTFLEDTPRRTLMLSMAIAGLLGMLMGGVMAFIANLILIYFRAK